MFPSKALGGWCTARDVCRFISRLVSVQRALTGSPLREAARWLPSDAPPGPLKLAHADELREMVKGS